MLADPFEQFAAVYERGFAVGAGTIMDDTMTFRFKDEVFSFPTLTVHRLAKWNGYFYEIPVEKLRALKDKPEGQRPLSTEQ